ncbi:MAG: FAD-dependent oxidoreductase [candidate division Zixibacteria bacterium]|nr:FAD-dependent oxidoreductase [candidate division Zixibacteria bacterium]
MKRDLSTLVQREYDLAIIGGGIFGVCAGWDAALRGLSVAIIEKKDFCHASSANHLRMVHGGIRYLQHGDIYRVRESSRERSELLRIAPHLVRPLPIIIPTYGHGIKGKGVLGTGMFLYDLVTLDRNWGIRDAQRRIPRGRFISRQEILKLFPGLDQEGLTGGAVFCDGQIHNPQRLGLSFLRSAVNLGGDAANYLEVTKFLRQGDRISGIAVRDVLTGGEFEIRSRVVLNAAGGWAHRLLEAGLGLQLDPKPTFSRDLAFVIPRRMTNGYGFACPLKTKDVDAILDRGGRHLFVVPWQGNTLIGVWHVIFDRLPDEIGATEKELQGFISEFNEAYPGFSLGLEDVSMILTGLTLFGDESKTSGSTMSFGKRSRLIDHGREHRIEGLVTLIGVRATTARGMAEKAVDIALEKLGRSGPRSQTAARPIYGGEIDCFDDFLTEALKQPSSALGVEQMRALLQNYGSQYREVLKYAQEDPTWIEAFEGSTALKAEVLHAVREEMAQTLGDVVFRRTDLGPNGNVSEEALRACADLMAKELGWDERRSQKELQEVRTTLERRGFLVAEDRGR